MARCDAELCPNWTGDGCICVVMDLPRNPICECQDEDCEKQHPGNAYA